ncbi:MAG: hypothetical protein WC881_04805 [Elusimicrobiota bacterium]|jgi:hypothetical protein
MTDIFKILVGGGCFLLGLGYLYRPDLIERMYTFLRETLLNDAHLALERRKWGAFFLLVGFLFLYMGLTAMGRP